MADLTELKNRRDDLDTRLMVGYAISVLDGITFTYGPEATGDELRAGIANYRRGLTERYNEETK